METEGSLPHWQEPTTCPYPQPDRSSLCPHPTSLNSILILSSHICLGLPSGLLRSDFFTKTLYAPVLAPIRTTCPAHLNLLDLITRMSFGEEYGAWSPSLHSLLHYPVILPLLGPNILLSTLFSKTLRLCSSLSASDQVSRPYKTTGKITVPYILIH
jgi:hypothetical protein